MRSGEASSGKRIKEAHITAPFPVDDNFVMFGCLVAQQLIERRLFLGAEDAMRRRAARSGAEYDEDAAGQKQERRRAPQKRVAQAEARLEQHELAIARNDIIHHLLVGVAGDEALA